MKTEGLERFFPFQNFIIDIISYSGEKVKALIHPDRRKKLICPHCSRTMRVVEKVERTVSDIPWGAKPVEIVIQTVMGRCSHCGSHHVFLPEEIQPFSRATSRFKLYVSTLARYMSCSAVALLLGISDDTVRRWDQEILESSYGEINLDNVEAILVDEKAIGKNHDYATLVLNAHTGELLYMEKGKRKESLQGFFDILLKARKQGIDFACMDRNAGFEAVVKENCPDAQIIFDKFHLVSNLSDAIDKIRREETVKALAEKKDIIKGERYNLLRHRENLTPDKRERLDELLKLNEPLNKAYLLKEAFREFWDCSCYQKAYWFLKHWHSQCVESGLKPLIRFSNGLLKRKKEIVNILRFRYTNGPMEAFNGVVARIIGRGYGYRNLRYLFLKCRQQSCTKANIGGYK
ncbi:MAG: ISL3 family transposase [Fibrobacter sp.]|nr:ISL3 family transposase [Fibrobacter sp.]